MADSLPPALEELMSRTYEHPRAAIIATLRAVADLLETSDDGNGDLFFREWAEMIAQPQRGPHD